MQTIAQLEVALNTSLFRPSCIALMPAIEKNPASACARVTVYNEPATRSVVAAHYTRIQLKPRIYSIGGFKAMHLSQFHRRTPPLTLEGYALPYSDLAIKKTGLSIHFSNFELCIC